LAARRSPLTIWRSIRSPASLLVRSLGDELKPGLARVEAENKLTAVPLAKVEFLKATLPNPPEDKVTGEGPRARNRRSEAITDLAFAQGKLLVSGLTNEAAPSKVREFDTRAPAYPVLPTSPEQHSVNDVVSLCARARVAR